jgi:transcription elongation factor Elf1
MSFEKTIPDSYKKTTMVTVDVVCPHCGKEVKATTAPGSEFKSVVPELEGKLKSKYMHSENKCKFCGGVFQSVYKPN